MKLKKLKIIRKK